jgi:dipeptidyl aminopeptidase/acylaminoacyl peptidase
MRFFRPIPAWKLLVVATAFFAIAVEAAPPPRPLLEPTPEALLEFYLPPDFRGAKLSPDGRRLAMVARSGDLFSVAVFDLSTGKTAILPGLKDSLAQQVWWLGEQRLLVEVIKPRGEGYTHVALNLDGSDSVEAWQISSDRLAVLDPRPGPVDEVLLADQTGVWAHNLRTKKRRVVQPALPMRVGRWYQDASGQVRAAMAAGGDNQYLYWRASGTAAWQSITTPYGDPGIFALGFDRDGRYLWVEDATRGDRAVIARFDTATGRMVETPGLPEAEATWVVTEGERELPLALTYAQVPDLPCAALSPADQAALARLQATLAGYEFDFIGRVPATTLWVLQIRRSRVPGTIVLFDWKTGQLSLVGQAHGTRLPEAQLASAERLRLPSSHGPALTGLLWRPAGTAKAPLVIAAPTALQHPPGRDTFYPDVQALVALGFAVAEIDHRGTRGFGRRHQDAIRTDPARTLREDYVDAVTALREDGRIDATRVAYLGDGLGATFVLATVAAPSPFTAAVAIDTPAEVTRDAIFGSPSPWVALRNFEQAGGWSESARLAAALSPKNTLSSLQVPALLVYRPSQIRRQGALAENAGILKPLLAQAAVPTRMLPPRSWPQDWRTATEVARDKAEVMAQIGVFLRENLGAPKP